MRIQREDTIGIVIDIQERLLPAMKESEALLKNCLILIAGLNELKVPLIVTQQYTKGLGNTISEIQGGFKNFSFIEKNSFSCCDEPLFMKELKKADADNVLIFGIESHVCVLQTAVDLNDLGYNPIVVMDCVSSRSAENYDIAKERFRHEGIKMTSVESILFELTRTSSATEFKAISKLVK
jgi:nicotinamidase-related amidase